VRLEKRLSAIVLELQRKQLVLDRGTIGCPESQAVDPVALAFSLRLYYP